MTALTPEQQHWLKRYRCPACPSGFDTLAAKKAHIKTEHPKGAKRRG